NPHFHRIVIGRIDTIALRINSAKLMSVISKQNNKYYVMLINKTHLNLTSRNVCNTVYSTISPLLSPETNSSRSIDLRPIKSLKYKKNYLRPQSYKKKVNKLTIVTKWNRSAVND